MSDIAPTHTSFGKTARRFLTGGLAVFLSSFTLFAGGNFWTCFAQAYGASGGIGCERTDGTMSEMPESPSLGDSFGRNGFDCCAANDHFPLLISPERPTKETRDTAVSLDVSIWRDFAVSQISAETKTRRPPPDPPNTQDYASLVGIVKNLN